ncbi:RING-H2 finger protein [Quillaja saponaria]|uniref:RING-type E3 ubiquitin transferase n=1 Tax=Quillaja saponaria TaxID=32244 RepID=A0AAD7QA12_QUISA|nr:RING-H2 finger protein [Quillaja saponaria]
METDITGPHSEYALNGKIMLCFTIILFIAVMIIIFFHRYLCCHSRHIRHLFSISDTANNKAGAGLDPSVLKFLPTFAYCNSSVTHFRLPDCAVCLSDFEDGDGVRFLPNCNHTFHTHCIDMWFGSHSNCPLCRAEVYPVHGLGSSNLAPPQITKPGSDYEADQMEEGQAGCSSLPPPVACQRKPLELMVIIVEEPVGMGESQRLRNPEGINSGVSGEYGSKHSDNLVISLKRIWSM